MGTDIHFYIERKMPDGTWKCINPLDYYESRWNGDYTKPHIQELSIGRDYQLFGILSKGLRTTYPDGFPQRGLPKNASTIVKQRLANAHSTNYLTLYRLETLFSDMTKTISREIRLPLTTAALLIESIEAGTPNWQLIKHEHWHTSPDPSIHYKQFTIDMPLIHAFNTFIKEVMIDYLHTHAPRNKRGKEKLKGNDIRIVFGFDS